MTNNMPRIHSLDGLRAVSILLVLIGHIAGTVNSPAWLLPLHNLGNLGVKVFFVISGFLITYLLLEELGQSGKISFRGFYLRRTFRIFPAFYFYILCVVIANQFGYLPLMQGDLLHASTFTMNYHHEREWALNHTWSLAVEEQFYLLWPLALFALGVRRALYCAILMLAVAPLIRAGMWYGFDASPSAMTREFQAVGDSVAVGCWLAVAYHRGCAMPWWFKSNWFFIVPLSLPVVPALFYKFDPGLFYVVGQSYVNFAAAAVIWRFIGCHDGISFRILNHRVLVWLGMLSYSLYLWQQPFLNDWSIAWFATWPVNLALTFVCAMLSFYLIERPFHRLGRTLAKRVSDCKTVVADSHRNLAKNPITN